MVLVPFNENRNGSIHRCWKRTRTLARAQSKIAVEPPQRWLDDCCLRGMRKFFLFAVLLTAFFIWLNRNDSSKPATPNPTTQTGSRPVSEHDWAKRSLDRASAVADQARKNQVESQQP
jgi:hypothetical protein